MNCTCIEDIEKKALDRLIEKSKFNKPVKAVKMQGVVIQFGGNQAVARTSNTLEIELEGQKKKSTMSMLHSYCPFCGVKQEPKS